MGSVAQKVKSQWHKKLGAPPKKWMVFVDVREHQATRNASLRRLYREIGGLEFGDFVGNPSLFLQFRYFAPMAQITQILRCTDSPTHKRQLRTIATYFDLCSDQRIEICPLMPFFGCIYAFFCIFPKSPLGKRYVRS
jgi:hypothetical protein